MKRLAKTIVGLINSLWLSAFRGLCRGVRNSKFLFVDIRFSAGNTLTLVNCNVSRSSILAEGTENIVAIADAAISSTEIQIRGSGNKLEIERGVRLHGLKIVIQGDRCMIRIRRNTIINGGRMVSSGVGNSIDIGEGCMFSDQIEIWASDTHPIYNEVGEVINQEKPIMIGNEVWVGCRATILKGVTIGDGSVIGMGTVVTSNVPSKCISVGHPNRVIRAGITWKKDHL